MNRSYFIFVVVALGVIAAIVWVAGGRFLMYIDFPSVAAVFLITVPLLASSFRLKEIGSFFKAAFRGVRADASTLKKGICFFSAMRRYLIISAVLGTMIGVIAMLSVLGEPSALGRGMALALLTIMYAVILILTVALPFRVSLERKLAEKDIEAGGKT